MPSETGGGKAFRITGNASNSMRYTAIGLTAVLLLGAGAMSGNINSRYVSGAARHGTRVGGLDTTTGISRPESDSAAFRYVYTVIGRYVNDHSLIRVDSLWHLFYTDGSMSIRPWLSPGNEINIEHAVSPDLVNWTQQETALTIGPEGSLDDEHLYAPNVIAAGGKYYMFYTGNDQGFLSGEHIFMAVSDDLNTWKRTSGLPIMLPDSNRVAYAPATDGNVRPVSFRDPFILPHTTYGYICYYVTRLKEDKGRPSSGREFACVAAATSPDLMTWTDRGPVLTRRTEGYDYASTYAHPESPCVVKRDDLYYLFWKGGAGTRYVISDNPLDFHDRDEYFLATSHASKVVEWGDSWYITSCSRWVHDATHTLSDRTKGLFIGGLEWRGRHPAVVPFSPPSSGSR